MRNSIHLTFLIIFQRVNNVGGMVPWCYNCPSQKWQQRRSQVGACVPLDTVLQMLLRVMVSLRASTQFTPATSNAHAPLRDEEPNGRKLAHTIRWQIHMHVCIIAQELFTSSVHQKDRLCTTGAILLVDQDHPPDTICICLALIGDVALLSKLYVFTLVVP